MIVLVRAQGHALKKGLEKLVLRLGRACIFEHEADKRWAVVLFLRAVAVSHRFDGFKMADNTVKTGNHSCALVGVCKDRLLLRGKIYQALQGRLIAVRWGRHGEVWVELGRTGGNQTQKQKRQTGILIAQIITCLQNVPQAVCVQCQLSPQGSSCPKLAQTTSSSHP